MHTDKAKGHSHQCKGQIQNMQCQGGLVRTGTKAHRKYLPSRVLRGLWPWLGGELGLRSQKKDFWHETSDQPPLSKQKAYKVIVRHCMNSFLYHLQSSELCSFLFKILVGIQVHVFPNMLGVVTRKPISVDNQDCVILSSL